MVRNLVSTVLCGGVLSLLVVGGAAAGTVVGGGIANAVVVVPEPSSLALIAAGIGAVAWLKFRGRK